MDRHEYLKEFFKIVKEKYCMDFKWQKEGVLFAMKCLREKKSIDEAVELLEEKYRLIKKK